MILVLAAQHQVRDQWVDEHAYLESPNPGEYLGVWRTPRPNRTLVHVFGGDPVAMVCAGFERGPIWVL